MTEKEWLSCTDPLRMLEFLDGKASDRKLRLFAVGCCRGRWTQITSKTGRRAVETAEQYVDGNAEWKAMIKAGRAASSSIKLSGVSRDKWPHANIAARDTALSFAGMFIARSVVNSMFKIGGGTEGHALANLLRDVFGNPFCLVTIEDSWLSWKDGTIRKIAQRIYDDRMFVDMPILADALEEAGCTKAEVLGHCRGPGLHVRGCWLLDLLLGKA